MWKNWSPHNFEHCLGNDCGENVNFGNFPGNVLIDNLSNRSTNKRGSRATRKALQFLQNAFTSKLPGPTKIKRRQINNKDNKMRAGANNRRKPGGNKPRANPGRKTMSAKTMEINVVHLQILLHVASVIFGPIFDKPYFALPPLPYFLDVPFFLTQTMAHSLFRPPLFWVVHFWARSDYQKLVFYAA